MALLPECLAVDVLRWRLAAAGIWHLVLVLSVSCTTRAVLGSHVPPISLTLLSQALAFLGQIALFKPHPPISSPILIPWVPLGLRIALSRALGPLSSLASLASSVTAAASLWLSALLSLSLTLDLKLAERKAIVWALLAVFERGSDAADAARALGALCRSAVWEDRSGVVQVARPGVGEVTHALLGTLGRVRALERRARALPPAALDLAAALGGGGRRGEDAALAPVWALQDALSTSLAGLADAYGAGLTSALAGALGARGGAGAAQEAMRLLAPFME
ncbi:hypothetical protein APUTEX25_004264 [Auxenochlorella protothecoides]|uniref:Uncharacterized protein n=1 Tax=Auxenochlorella protothecoides TaxID=3075 RepID=A0A3M7L644_AUXPR|nr:hypothetical protein APUTEX25_004264 [Auxenochlorella protothecoides]|eukprot:RMZ57430.1 hypothetical protein APUTEX25_004264 [Auxenochlorella protothecoides]